MRINEKTKFILKYGALGWGILTAVLFTIFEIFLNGLGDWKSFMIKFIIYIIIFSISGCFWGLIIWKYKTVKNSDKKK